MFHIKYKLNQSSIHGIGIFADQNIKKGEKIYTSNLILDLFLTPTQFDDLTEVEKWPIAHYGYQDKTSNLWHLAHDDIRFCNHSLNGNITISGEILIGKHDITKGEELLQDYCEFEELRKILWDK